MLYTRAENKRKTQNGVNQAIRLGKILALYEHYVAIYIISVNNNVYA